MKLTKIIQTSVVAVASVLGVAPALAQNYPTKPIKIIAPFAAGGNLDLTARVVGKYLQEELGQPIIVENRAGAGGAIGMRAVQTAPADGYTLVVTAGGPMIAQPYLQKSIGYGLADFTPISLLAVSPLVFVVPKDSKFDSIKSFVAQAKANPGKLNYGASSGTANHIGFETFNQLAGIDVQMIPYKGSSQVLVDLLGDRLSMSLEQVSGAQSYISKGDLKPLAVSTPVRVPSLPNVPTMQELGYPSFNETTWNGLVGPAGLPENVRARLIAALSVVLSNPAFVGEIEKMGAMTANVSGDNFKRFLQEENTKFVDVAKKAGLEPQ